ncbi:MAG TPA: hypothetical protein VF776_01225 [Sphingomicrobium sp.]
MKQLFVPLALGLLSALTASPALAAPGTAERLAACLAQSRPDLARELLQATSSGAVTEPLGGLIQNSRCLSQAFGDQQFSPSDEAFSQPTLRGNLAEQLLLKQSAAVAALQPLPLQQKRYLRPWFAATGRHPAVDEMAACMADTDPAQVAALIKTEPGSSEERAAFEPMSAALTKCLSAGTQLDVDRQAIRAALADALYQRLTNPQLSMVEVKK